MTFNIKRSLMLSFPPNYAINCQLGLFTFLWTENKHKNQTENISLKLIVILSALKLH